MDIARQILIDLSNHECVSGSLNGPSLLETLRSLSPEEAASTDTYERYSAWSVAIHVLYFKHPVAVELGADIPAYQYGDNDFPDAPETPTKEAWEKLIGEIEATHYAFVTALASVDDAKLAGTYAKWDMSLGASVEWVISHDVNHNGQIRNARVEI